MKDTNSVESPSSPGRLDRLVRRCPFCGCVADIQPRNTIKNDTRTAYFVGCHTKLCRGNATTGSFDLNDELTRWNRRADARPVMDFICVYGIFDCLCEITDVADGFVEAYTVYRLNADGSKGDVMDVDMHDEAQRRYAEQLECDE